MTQDDLRKEIRELRAQIEALRTALSDVTRPYTELMAYVDRLQDVSRGYFRVLELFTKYGKVSPDLVIPGLKDDISRHIVVSLFDQPDRNISQIAEAVKGKRGTASRGAGGLPRLRQPDDVVSAILSMVLSLLRTVPVRMSRPGRSRTNRTIPIESVLCLATRPYGRRSDLPEAS